MLARRIVSTAKRESLKWRILVHSAASSAASSPSLSIWRRKKEMGKEGIFVVQELKRLFRSSRDGRRLEGFLKSGVSRLVRTDLLAVLAELQRQNLVMLSLKVRSLTLTLILATNPNPNFVENKVNFIIT